MQYLFLLLIIILSLPLTAQENPPLTNELRLNLYADGYFALRNSNNKADRYDPLTTVGARDNSLGLNVGQIGLHYTSEKVRGNLVLHDGDIAGATWDTEFRYVQQANVGLKLQDKLWFDIGFFTTHVGAEGFLPRNNFLSSTAVLTFQEPFYQAGAKLTYTPSEDWTIELWLLNGYNLFVDNNDAKSVGLLVSRSLGEESSISYSNILGREPTNFDDSDQFRIYQNISINRRIAPKMEFQLGVDLGAQLNSKLNNEDEPAILVGGLLALRRTLNERFSLSTRLEYFNDPSGFVSGIFQRADRTELGVQIFGLTLGGEYHPAPDAYLRLEGRWLSVPRSGSVFFRTNDGGQDDRLAVMLTAGVSLERRWRW